MARFGLIVGGLVVRVAPSAGPAGQWEELPDGVTNGDAFDGVFIPSPSALHSWNNGLQQWELDPAKQAAADAAKDADAVSRADQIIGRALLRLSWDQEERLRAAGQDSALAPIRNALNEAEYRQAVVDYIKSLL